jgi:2-polyprenyl-3-methyl-5-hydroxy-6-metoxy-1,4-benzoquinol methylase
MRFFNFLTSKIKNILDRPTSTNFIGFDKYKKSGAYHWNELRTNSEYRSLIEFVAEYIKPNDIVLDIGCGDGAYLGYISNSIKFGYGVDAETQAAKLANNKFKENHILNCKAYNLSIGQSKKFFSSNLKKFDLVWTVDVIEHLPNPGELLEFITLVLKKNKYAIIGTPLLVRDDLISKYHIKEYTILEMREIIEPFLKINHEKIMPHTRKDGVTYEQGYYFAVCTLK